MMVVGDSNPAGAKDTPSQKKHGRAFHDHSVCLLDDRLRISIAAHQ
jgi:hypothetical protein